MKANISLFDDDRGISGIDTLIIFIAMVLVAALAAGVVLNTAGFLQSQAEQTGEDSTDQVSDQLQIITVTGVVEEDAEETVVSQLNAKVFKSPGAGDIALDEVTVQYLSSDSDETLNSDDFEVDALRDDDTSLEDDILNSRTDRAEIQFDLDAIADVAPLDTGEQVTLRFTTQSGAQTVYVVTVPDSLYHGSQSVVEL